MPTLTKPTGCEGCTLYTQPGPVFGEGNLQTAKIAYVAQNPGQHECKADPMRPLIGPSGNVFNRQLFEAGLARTDVYITNQVKCLTPLNREPTQLEINKCKRILDGELSRLKADVVVLAGDIAFRENIGNYSTLSPHYHPSSGKPPRTKPAGIMSRMGCVEQKDGKKWIGTIHPAFIMRMPDYAAAGPLHLGKAASLSGYKLPLPNIRERVTNAEVLEFVDKTILGSREFADDVETVGMEDVEEDDYVGGDWQVTMLGVCNSSWESLVLSTDQIPLLSPIFEDPGIWRYEHNGEYDNYFLERYIRKELMENKKHDTMQGAHWLRSYAPKKLKPYVLSTYTWLPYYNRDLGRLSERLYNGMDLLTTFQAAREQRRQLKLWELEEVFYSLGMPILPILEEWRRIGTRVDVHRALLFKRIIEAKITKAEGLISKIAGPFFTWTNHFHIKKLLYETYALPPQYKKAAVRGAPDVITSDYEARKHLRRWIEEDEERTTKYKPAYLLLNLLDFISGEGKKLEYIGRISPDGRIHPNYRAHAQESFRLGAVPNVQNIPIYDISAWGGARRDDNDTADHPLDVDKEEERNTGVEEEAAPKLLGSLRSLILADRDEDWLITADFEQMQIWILAAQFKVQWLLDVFESGDYLYGGIYEKLYGEPFFQEGKPRTKKYKLEVSEQRIRRVKAVPLGFLFNRTAAAVATEYNMPKHEGDALRAWWFDLCKELPPAYSKVEYQVKQKGWYRHAFGQIAHYPSRKSTEVINACAQSNEAMIMRGTIILIAKEIERRGLENTRTMLGVHDSLTATAPTRHVVEVAEDIFMPTLTRAIPQLGGFKFRASLEISKQWDWNVMKLEDWKAQHSLPLEAHQDGR